MRRILWFRRDLRTTDNPLLSHDAEVLPIFIFDSNILKKLNPDDKRVAFLFQQVIHLKKALRAMKLDLLIFYGDPLEVFKSIQPDLFYEVVASGDYDESSRKRDLKIAQMLHFKYLEDTYLFSPNAILKKDQTPYLVFTPFYKQAIKLLEKTQTLPYKHGTLTSYDTNYEGINKIEGTTRQRLPLTLESIGFQAPSPQETDPHTKLERFAKKIKDYETKRDYFACDATSSLSVDLRFGTLSVREILRATQKLKGAEAFIRQLIFRDFYAYLLFHFPHLKNKNYKYRFFGIPNQEKFARFCNAQTGVPLIDAGIRELLQTGRIHNRVRMVTASFFTKDLLLPWQWGEAFFAKNLLDYDEASNILSWQWSAGTGIDPQPYFRIFNPYLQAKKFDKEAHYIKKWIPELAQLEAKHIHEEAHLLTHEILDYPAPIVSHHEASKIALDYFKTHR